MMKRMMIVAGLMLAVAAFAVTEESQDPDKTPITQGAFCVKVVKIMKARLPEGVSEQDALSFLETLGLKPRQGWNIAKPLTEQVLGDVLVIVGSKLTTISPDVPVSITRAEIILHRHANLFRKYYLSTRTDDNNTENQIVDEGALTGTPLSPCQTP
jgi:hypothetical protein